MKLLILVAAIHCFHCCTGKRVTSTSASPTANDNLVPTDSGHSTESIPDPCNATLDTIMLGEPEVNCLAAVVEVETFCLVKGPELVRSEISAEH